MNKITYYLVHWKGFSSSENSWQSKDKLNCPILIKEYHEKSEDALIKSELLKKAALENAKKGNHEFEVEEIVGHQIKKGILSYLVRWLGWGAKDDTWVPENQLSCSALIKAYETRIVSCEND